MNRYTFPFLILILLGSLPIAQAEELGRLFYTPQQRVQLETQQITSQSVESVKSESGSKPTHIIVNGIIQKQGGNRIVWINGTAQAAGKSNEQTPATVPVTVPGKTQPVPLKVGQRLMLDPPVQSPSQNPADATNSEKTTTPKPVTKEDD